MTSSAQVLAIDIAERAGKSFGQGAAAVAAPVLLAANASTVLNASWWQQLGTIILVGGLTGIGSVLTSIASAVKTGTASASKVVAQSTPLAVDADTAGSHAAAPDPAPVDPPAEDDSDALPPPVYAPDPSLAAAPVVPAASDSILSSGSASS